MVKRVLLLFMCFFFVVPLFPQVENQSSGLNTIEVPVRVYSGSEFIDSLTLDDFIILENGENQQIDALYLFDGLEVVRQEDPSGLVRNQKRHYFFLFQIFDYDPKIAEAIYSFFENVLVPNDSLTVATHKRTYTLSPKALDMRTKVKLANELISLIQRDTEEKKSNYVTLLNSFRRVFRSLISAARVNMSDTRGAGSSLRDGGYDSVGVQDLLGQYRQYLDQLSDQRVLDENTLKDFTTGLQGDSGQKYVFLFYQREFKPELDKKYLNTLQNAFSRDKLVMLRIQELYKVAASTTSLDVAGLRQACADSGAQFYFIYSDNQSSMLDGARMRDWSEEFYSAFSEIANATGGKVASSFDPDSGFLECLENSEKYYLLYYSSSNPVADGSFRTITVRLKNLPYSLSHRMGYLAVEKKRD